MAGTEVDLRPFYALHRFWSYYLETLPEKDTSQLWGSLDTIRFTCLYTVLILRPIVAPEIPKRPPIQVLPQLQAAAAQ